MKQAVVFESFQDSLRAIIQAAGGSSVVGPMIWTTIPTDQAGRRLCDCLNTDRRQHLDENETLFLLRLGQRVGCHAGMEHVSTHCGYAEPQPVYPKDERALQKEFRLAAAEAVQQVAKRLADLGIETPSSLRAVR